MRDTAVKLTDITKIFKSKKSDDKVIAVNNFDLKIEEGELVTLLGPSGCGKTTTLRMVAGFETPSSGSIYLDGDDVVNRPANKRDTAMVFQSYGLFPHMTIYENITYGLRFKDMNKKAVKEKAEKIMELVGLSGYGSRNPGELSGGQQQRVALARALIVEPKVLLFDEPLSNLDAKLRESMRDEIRKLQKRLSITSLYVTHDQIEAMSISDRIVVMNKGEIEQIGSPEEIYYKPDTKFVADFIGKVNFLSGSVSRKEGDSIDIDLGYNQIEGIEQKIDLDKNEKVTVAVRPESLILAAASQGVFDAEVIRKTYLGSYYQYVLEMPDQNIITVDVVNPINKEEYEVGEKVSVSFPIDELHIIAEA